MRAGGCAVQQALAAEAAAVVRQAVAVARRRGHAQVTPLHVASALLSSPAGVLRAACLRAHSHPLQCKALELCFNVALNRLPTAGPAAIFHHHGHGGAGGAAPALSNALVAAFKRAQAHQRRGGAEGHQAAAAAAPQQPPALAARVELEQLIVSILDDPSVSRVMREAGFSSAQVKANVEKVAVSSVSSPPADHTPNAASGNRGSTTTSSSPSSRRAANAAAVEEDAMRVLDRMAGGGRRGVVVVGESAAAAEAVVNAVMDRVSKGELQPRHERRLKNLQFVPLSAASFRRAPPEEVEAKAGDLRALARQGCAAGKGVVLVVQDLACAAEAWAAASERRRRHGHSYCPVEHAVMEVSRLVSAAGAGAGLDRFWLLGFGSNEAYTKCRSGQPSLEAVWELHAVVVPDGGLSLSLSSSSETEAAEERSRTGWPFVNGRAAGESELTARAEAVVAMPGVPPWLRRYQDPDQTRPANCSTSLKVQDWNANFNGSAARHTSELTLSFSSPAATTSPVASSISGFAHSYNANLMMMSSKPWQFMPMQPWLNHQNNAPIMGKSYVQQPLNTSTSPESYSVSNSSEGGQVERPKFMELTAENLKILCNALERRAPRHKDMVADIASTVLECRSGMARRMRRCQEKPSVTTWLLFQGSDIDGKKAVAQELSRLVFGSYSEFTSISLAEFTPVHTDSSSGELILKRQRSSDNGHGYVQKLYEVILENPHRVIMIDSTEQLDCDSEISIRNAIANGKIRGCNGHEISLEDAIVILCCEELNSRSFASSPRLKQRIINKDGEGDAMCAEKGMETSCLTLDLNACAEDEDQDEGSVPHDVWILNVVDGVFFFRSTEDL
ncbi:hypothetical protein ACP4OV_014567 [Aristida adscensionis]